METLLNIPQPILAIIFPGMLSGITLFFGYVQYNKGLKDKKQERELNFDQQRESEMSKERDRISRDMAGLMQNIHKDLDDCRAQLDRKNRDGFYAWDRARFWHQKAWDMRNEAAYARQIVDSGARIAGNPPPVWFTSLDLPPFDDSVIQSRPGQSAG